MWLDPAGRKDCNSQSCHFLFLSIGWRIEIMKKIIYPWDNIIVINENPKQIGARNCIVKEIDKRYGQLILKRYINSCSHHYSLLKLHC